MNCKNCEKRIDGQFCSQCGQRAKVRRINLPNFLNEISDSVFQVNKGLFYTIKQLSVRPGNSLREFLDGKRKAHFKPIAYVLTLSTGYFLITQFTGQNTWIDDMISGWIEGASGAATETQAPKILIWGAKNYAYSSLLLLPIFSLASYLAFLKFDTNYLEHIVINSYITGHQAILYSLFAMAGVIIESDAMEVLPLLAAIAYTFWVYWQFFSTGNRIMHILRFGLTYLLYLLFSVGVLFVLMGLYEI